MITKNQIQLLTSLQIKKFRNEHGLFIAEGEKISALLLNSSYKIHSLYATKEWLTGNKISNDLSTKIFETSNHELQKISGLSSPQEVIIVAEIPNHSLQFNDLNSALTLVFDEIKDPGNLGTIIRIADWFGIRHIICSPDSVDVFNPKVIQATMGSFCHVEVHYLPLEELFSWNHHLPVYGTAMDGKNLYECDLEPNGLIVFGNESRGIKQKYKSQIDQKIKIPSFNNNPSKAESLNISIAAGIVCSEFRRRGN